MREEEDPGEAEDTEQSSSSSAEDIPAWAADDPSGKQMNVEGLGQDHRVCLSWLNGMCTRGSNCPYIHRFDLKKMPDCVREASLGECRDEGCPFRHHKRKGSAKKGGAKDQNDDDVVGMDDPQHAGGSRGTAPCPYFFFGMCPHGEQCKLEHIYLPGPPPPPWKLTKWFVEGKLPKKWHKYIEPIAKLPSDDDGTVVDWFFDYGGVNPNGTEFDELKIV